MKKRNRVLVSVLILALVLMLSSCAGKGTVAIKETTLSRAFDISMKAWNGEEVVTLLLNAGDTVQVDIQCESGDIAMEMTGKKGSAPYSGKALSEMAFTVTVEETDTYTVTLKGNKATGEVSLAP